MYNWEETKKSRKSGREFMIPGEYETMFFRVPDEDETDYRWVYIWKNNDWEFFIANRDIDPLYPWDNLSCFCLWTLSFIYPNVL